jgi:hypothetical protein
VIKLKKLAGQITKLARQYVGGFGMYTEIGERVSTLEADKDRDTRSINHEVFADHDDTDLWDTLREWRKLEVADDAILDFYVYDQDELKDNLGILIRGGEIVAFNIVGDKIGDSYDAWRPIGGGKLQPKAFFDKAKERA